MKKLLIFIVLLSNNIICQPNNKNRGNDKSYEYVHNDDFNHPNCYRWCDRNSHHFDEKQCKKHCNNNNGGNDNHPNCYRWCDSDSKHFNIEKCEKHCNGNNNVPIDGGMIWLMIVSIGFGIFKIKKQYKI
ncbi:MAG: hypothetical protein ACOC33_03160 [bacterium]